MATAVQIRDAVDTQILARINRDGIESYSLHDGRSLKKCTLSEFLKVRETYATLAADEENGTSLRRFRYFDE